LEVRLKRLVLLIIAADVKGEALANCVNMHRRYCFKVAAAKALVLVQSSRKAMRQDIAVILVLPLFLKNWFEP